jgi:hypothetical protein
MYNVIQVVLRHSLLGQQFMGLILFVILSLEPGLFPREHAPHSGVLSLYMDAIFVAPMLTEHMTSSWKRKLEQV